MHRAADTSTAGPGARAARRPRAATTLGVILLCTTLTGCLGIGRESTPVRYWVLDSITEEPSAAGANYKVIGVGPINIPPYLERPDIVVRMDQNEVRIAKFHQWAEPLGKGIQRVLSENLNVLVPGARTIRFPWKGPITPDLQVAIEVTRFEVRYPQEVLLQASWEVVQPETRTRQTVRTSWIREQADAEDAETAIAGMSRALERLSREIGEALIEVMSELER